MGLTKSSRRRRHRQYFRDLALLAVEAAADGAAGEEGGGGVDGSGGADEDGGGGVDGAGGHGAGVADAVDGADDEAAGEVAGVADAVDGVDGPSANEGEPLKEKRISKAKMKEQKLGNWVPTLKDEDLGPLGSRVDAIIETEEAGLTIAEINEAILSNVEILEEIPTFFLSTDCSPEEFLLFIDQLSQHSLKVAPFTIPIEINGVEEAQVPVTPMKPRNIEDAAYHIIVLRHPGDRYEIHILVEDFSGYIKAFSIVLLGVKDFQKVWLRLGKDPLPSRFSPCDFTDYGEGYGTLNGIYMDRNMLNVIFSFFLGFDGKPRQMKTKKGQRILYTSFILLGETRRFPLAKEWAVEGISRGPTERLSLPNWFSGLIHDWHPLCMAIFELFIALQEIRLVNAGRHTPDADNAMVVARLKWKQCQVPHHIIQFFVEEDGVPAEATPIFMGALLGRHVSLVRHDYEAGNRALLRLIGYNGYMTLREIQEAYDAKKLA